MILQDLIRNYLLYRKVIKPLFGSWIGSYSKKLHLTPLYAISLASNREKIATIKDSLDWHVSDQNSGFSVMQKSGTRTISAHKRLPAWDSNLVHEAEYKVILASSSKNTCIVLVDNQVNEYTVDIGKTHNQSAFLSIEKETLSPPKTVNATTGFESKQINSFLIPETHEKREYLGEFSLTHEEIRLMNVKKGGEHHDTDQEPVTAIV